MIVTRAGAALIVFQDRMGGDWGKPITPMIMRSSHRGRTWSRPQRVGAPLDDGGRFHVKPTGIVEDRRSGRVHVFLSRSPITNDEGQTLHERWFYTHLQRAWKCGRTWFLVSADDGGTWGSGKVLEPGNAAYSDLALAPGGVILCAYETGAGSRKDLALARFTWDWLYRGP